MSNVIQFKSNQTKLLVEKMILVEDELIDLNLWIEDMIEENRISDSDLDWMVASARRIADTSECILAQFLTIYDGDA